MTGEWRCYNLDECEVGEKNGKIENMWWIQTEWIWAFSDFIPWWLFSGLYQDFSRFKAKKKCFVTENQLFNSNSGVLSLVSLTRIFIVKDKKDTGSIVGDLWNKISCELVKEYGAVNKYV